ncbi:MULTISPECIES: GNAT family N-acetyltransferase [unclassified Shewanella]|uniref:GNAT family N-acetyltransferase n=1 Tax=unclassified Shewanella TaxID=196818 RepID=UPI000C849E6E|nr:MULTISPECIES: GNAT family N-acetyltransferase [unclassified Shewanella]PMG44430.1 GNAT family N-acetyltransferase [Shewanella sp. 10N.286.52.B9]PMH87175.1 GNAT family N-acetyltransferase [Shewanella sp. 10N.286.48.B5]
MRFEFIQALEKDKPYLLDLRKLTMVEHLENSGQFLSDDEHEFRLNDAYGCSNLIIHNSELIGTLKYREFEDRIEIMQLQIHPNFQGKGLGRQVVEQVLTEAKFKFVELTVLKDNPAFRLYQRLGFSITGHDQYEYFMRTKHY